MKTYDNIKNMLCDELEEIAKKKELTTNSLEVLYKGIDIIKDIETIHAMEQEYPEDGYSRDGGYSQGYFGRMPYYMYDDGMSMSNGNSYARGRGRYANRDSMGRYSSEGDYSREGYSRDGMKEELRMMMDRARTDKERDALRKAMDSM